MAVVWHKRWRPGVYQSFAATLSRNEDPGAAKRHGGQFAGEASEPPVPALSVGASPTNILAGPVLDEGPARRCWGISAGGPASAKVSPQI